MKLLSPIAIVMMLGLAACGGKKDKAADAGAAGSAVVAVVAPDAAAAAPAAGSGSSAGSAAAAPAAGSGSAATASAGSGSAAAGSGAEEQSAFDKLSHEDKVKLMKEHMTPEMKTAFQGFDAKKFATFNCKTCHGKDPAKTKFKMPNPELPKLDVAALRAGKQAPKMAKFMGDVVEPLGAKIVGQEPYDPKTNKGFGCLECHEQKK
jgi:hypothetical protein